MLGDLSEAERDAVEDEYFSDDESFNRLLDAEADVFDAHAAGDLTARQRAVLEERILRDPDSRRRAQFARVLRRAGSRHGSSEAQPSPRRLVWTMVAAAAIVVAISLGEMMRLRSELREVRSTKQSLDRSIAAQKNRIDEQERQLASVRERLDALARPGTLGLLASVVLSAGARRDLNPMPELVLTPETSMAQLVLRLDPAIAGGSFDVSIQTPDGKERWTRRALKVNGTKQSPAILLDLLPGALPPGHYLAVLMRSGGKAEAEYVFRVVRSE